MDPEKKRSKRKFLLKAILLLILLLSLTFVFLFIVIPSSLSHPLNASPWPGILIVIATLLITFLIKKWESEALKDRNNLNSQIEKVAETLSTIRNFENVLENIKEDMIATEQAKLKIEEEYEKTQELEKLSAKQIQAISFAVNKRIHREIWFDRAWGFILGVLASIVASLLAPYVSNWFN